MTTALALPTNGSIVAWGMTRDQLDLLKRTVAQGTSDDEFALFMTTSSRLGLDPFAKHIYAVKRPTFDKMTRSYVDKMTIQVGIDGFRSVADRTGEHDGQDGPYWCGEDGAWRDVWLHDKPPSAARIAVYRKGCSKPFWGVATMRSYAQTSKDNKPTRQWEQMPDVMLAKCAEALALRKAFPTQLSGVYTPEEMAQGESEGAPRVLDSDARTMERRDLGDSGLSQIAAIDLAETEEQLKSLAPSLSKLSGDAKRIARGKYSERLAHLRQQSTDAEVAP